MILKLLLPKNLAIILAFFAQTTGTFCKNLIITLVVSEKRHLFRQKLAKIAENYKHNIDRWLLNLVDSLHRLKLKGVYLDISEKTRVT
jgi:hypothetical protein